MKRLVWIFGGGGGGGVIASPNLETSYPPTFLSPKRGGKKPLEGLMHHQIMETHIPAHYFPSESDVSNSVKYII